MTSVLPVNKGLKPGATASAAAPAYSGFFFERHRDVGIGAQTHCAIVLDRRDQALADIMMMPLMAAFPAVLLGQLDPVTVHMVDGADMDAIGADHFGMFLNAGQVDHDISPVRGVTTFQRPVLAQVATALHS